MYRNSYSKLTVSNSIHLALPQNAYKYSFCHLSNFKFCGIASYLTTIVSLLAMPQNWKSDNDSIK